MVGLQNGRVIAVENIDYKSDTLDPADAHIRGNVYRPQVDAYRAVVGKQFRLPLSKVRGTLFFVRAGELLTWDTPCERFV